LSWRASPPFSSLYATQPLLPLLMRVFDASHFAVSLTVTASTIAVGVAHRSSGRVADLVDASAIRAGSAFGLTGTALLATRRTVAPFIGWPSCKGCDTWRLCDRDRVWCTTSGLPRTAGRATRVCRRHRCRVLCGRSAGRARRSAYNWQIAFVVLAVANLIAAVLLTAWFAGETRKRQRRARIMDSRSLGC